MVRSASTLLVILMSAALAQAADPRDALARARTLYNQRQFDAAVAAADEARHVPDLADGADLIAARAFLERYRENSSPDVLRDARERLRRIDPGRFTAAERLELLVGLGEALYFDEESGAAAVLFESVLAVPDSLAPEARERVLDWWASALDRDARPRPEIDRQGVYQKIRDRMAEELGRNGSSGTASYWVSAAARGQGDLQAAWDAAQAGWVRAPLTADHGVKLRGDLDRLVQVAIVPERSRTLGQPAETLTAEWERFKAKWAGQP